MAEDYNKVTMDRYVLDALHLITTTNIFSVTDDNITEYKKYLDSISASQREFLFDRGSQPFGSILFKRDAQIAKVTNDLKANTPATSEKNKAQLNLLELVNDFNLESGASKSLSDVINNVRSMYDMDLGTTP